jgi:hypothetical protein
MSDTLRDLLVAPLLFMKHEQEQMLEQLISHMGIPPSFVTCEGGQDLRTYRQQSLDDHFIKAVQDVEDKTFLKYIKKAMEAVIGARSTPRDNVERNCR